MTSVDDIWLDIYIDDSPEWGQPYLAISMKTHDYTLCTNYLSMMDLAEALKPYLIEADTKG